MGDDFSVECVFDGRQVDMLAADVEDGEVGKPQLGRFVAAKLPVDDVGSGFERVSALAVDVAFAP